ncbi:MAG: ABC transporter permease [Gammaproteobacteria bacterium]|nr:ABC transporter permease [Gammaproteobacteria bacterium]
MDFIVATFRKDLTRWREDAHALIIWLAIPFLIGGLITAMAGGSGGSGPSGTLLIDDRDDTLISGFVAGAFAQDQIGDMLTVQNVGAEEGKQLIDAGEASGLLTIPEGFQDAFINDTPVVLTLKTNPAQTILPGIIENVTEVLLDAGFYLQALFGEEIAAIQGVDDEAGPSNAFVSSMSVQVNDKMQALGPALFPLAFDIEIVEPPPAEPRPDIGLLFLPGIVMMALLFSSQGLSADFWKERETGTLRRLVSSPGLLNQFVFGKALAATLVIAGISGITLAVGFLYHGIAWSKFLPSMLWLIFAGAGFFAWFAALQMLFPTQKAANLLSTIFLFPLMMMGGSFFPLAALPDWLASVGRMSPNGFVVDKLTDELVSANAWSFDIRSWTIVAAIMLSGLLLCSWRLKSGFARR